MRLRTYLAVNAELAGANSLPAAAPGLLEVLCRNLGWEMAALWRVDADAALIRCVDVWHLPDTGLIGFSLATRHAEFARGDGLPGRVWETAAPLWVPDVVAQPGGPRTPSAAREQVRAALAVPITTADGVVGVIELFGAGSAEPAPDMLELLSGIAAMVGQFIRRRDAERRLRAGEARKSAILNAALRWRDRVQPVRGADIRHRARRGVRKVDRRPARRQQSRQRDARAVRDTARRR
jgi:GAF domain-containing protein